MPVSSQSQGFPWIPGTGRCKSTNSLSFRPLSNHQPSCWKGQPTQPDCPPPRLGHQGRDLGGIRTLSIALGALLRHGVHHRHVPQLAQVSVVHPLNRLALPTANLLALLQAVRRPFLNLTLSTRKCLIFHELSNIVHLIPLATAHPYAPPHFPFPTISTIPSQTLGLLRVAVGHAFAGPTHAAV